MKCSIWRLYSVHPVSVPWSMTGLCRSLHPIIAPLMLFEEDEMFQEIIGSIDHCLELLTCSASRRCLEVFPALSLTHSLTFPICLMTWRKECFWWQLRTLLQCQTTPLGAVLRALSGSDSYPSLRGVYQSLLRVWVPSDTACALV